MTLPPDEDSCVQHILRSHNTAFIWKNFNNFVIPNINPYVNGWKSMNDMLVPVWFCGPQFSPSVQNHRKKRHNGYEADDESTKKRKSVEKTSTGKGRKFRKQLHVLASDDITKEVEPTFESEGILEHPGQDLRVQVSGNDGSNEEGADDSVLSFNGSDEWEHFSEFSETSDSSDSDWI